MQALSFNPVLGHVTTFGGHPVSCAAGKAAFDVLLQENYIASVRTKETILIKNLNHPAIQEKKHFGLWVSLQFESIEVAQRIIHGCVEQGLITDWFLFAPDRMRIAPPLTISEAEIEEACKIILNVIDENG